MNMLKEEFKIMFGGWTMFSQIMQHNGDVQIQFLFLRKNMKYLCCM